MEGHAPTITTLRPGILRAHRRRGRAVLCVTGGFAEITATGVSVLAERAIPVEEADRTLLDGMIAEARALAAMALPEDRDAADEAGARHGGAARLPPGTEARNVHNARRPRMLRGLFR